MTDNKKYETPNDKIAEWFKRNLENFILAIVCLIYIFRGFATIDRFRDNC